MKKLLALLLGVIAVLGTAGVTASAQKGTQTVNVDGTQVELVAYNIDDNNYFKLRDIACVLSGSDTQFDVAWIDGSVEITKEKAYSGEVPKEEYAAENPEIVHSSLPLYVDGRRVSAKAYNIDGYTYFKLRDVAKLIDFGVFWSQESGILIDTSRGYTLTAEEEKILYIEYAHRRHPEFVNQNEGWNEDLKYYNFADVDRDGRLELLVKKSAGITVYKAVDGEVQRMFCDTLPESSGTYQYHYATYQGKDYIAYVNGGSSEPVRLYILEGTSLVMLYEEYEAKIQYPQRYTLYELK